ncbi:serine hydrolase domain-containing protein [Neolewinella litorea]|nr:serine hydrolase [Neolewinella litorea]
MKSLLLTAIACLSLFSAAASESSAGWGEWVIEWVTSLFSPEVQKEDTKEIRIEPKVDEATLSTLHTIPGSDTLTLTEGWPYESLNVAGDVDRRSRLLAQTVLVGNPGRKLPLATDHPVRVIYPAGQRPDRFLRMARRFTDVQEIAFSDRLAPALAAAPALPTVVVATDPPGGLSNDDWYESLYTIGDYTLVHFGDAELLDTVPDDWGLINTPLRSKESEAFVAQSLFGAQALFGRLPGGAGVDLPETRQGFREPEVLGIDRSELASVDHTLNRAVRYQATPGAQLTVLKDGHVVYERAYGNHKYRGGEAVRVSDLYDLASVTKAAATTLAVMKLYDEGRLDLQARVSDYLPEYKRQVPGRYRIDQLLTHHTGLDPSLPLYTYIHAPYVADTADERHPLRLSESRWLDGDVPRRLRQDLAKVPYTRTPIHRYSDINYVLLQFVVESVTGLGLDEYVNQEFFEPMGLRHLAFRPLERFAPRQLVPTIVDRWINRGEVRGYVHDEGAALLGGVAGHAGLFGNATDLARLFQLLIDGGSYGGQQLVSEKTVQLFTEQGPYNYRALGFDRLERGYGSITDAGASARTFGHTGFTGTCVWADPDTDLVFVLLTNRTYPDPENKKFMQTGVRSRVHRDVYRALHSFESYQPV